MALAAPCEPLSPVNWKKKSWCENELKSILLWLTFCKISCQYIKDKSENQAMLIRPWEMGQRTKGDCAYITAVL